MSYKPTKLFINLRITTAQRSHYPMNKRSHLVTNNINKLLFTKKKNKCT